VEIEIMPTMKDILENKQTIFNLVHDWGFNTTEEIGRPKLYKDPYNSNKASLCLLVITDPNKQELIKDEHTRKARLAYEIAILTKCKVLVTTLKDYSNNAKLQEEIQKGAIELNSSTNTILKYYEDKPTVAELEQPKLQKLRVDLLLPKDPEQILNNHKQHIKRVLGQVYVNNSYSYALFENKNSHASTMNKSIQDTDKSVHLIKMIESELAINDEPNLLFSLQQYFMNRLFTMLSRYMPVRFFQNEQRITEVLMSQQGIYHHIMMRHERLLILANASNASHEHALELVYKAILNQMQQLKHLKLPIEDQDNYLLSASKHNYESILKNHVEQPKNHNQLSI
jgi:hypothetical protein